jgi:hypothetical protein
VPDEFGDKCGIVASDFAYLSPVFTKIVSGRMSGWSEYLYSKALLCRRKFHIKMEAESKGSEKNHLWAWEKKEGDPKYSQNLNQARRFKLGFQ